MTGPRECGERVYECGAVSHLHLHDRLDLSDKDLSAGHLLVCHLKCNALMVQRAHVVCRVYCMPDLVPLTLRALWWA